MRNIKNADLAARTQVTKSSWKKGVHQVAIIEARLGESATGKARIELHLMGDDGEEIRRDLYYTDAARAHTKATMESLGVDIDALDFLGQLDRLRGTRVNIRIKFHPLKAEPDVSAIWPIEAQPSQEELLKRFRQGNSVTVPEDDDDELLDVESEVDHGK